MTALVILLGTLVGAFLIVTVWPERTQRFLRRILFARKIVFGTLAILTALILIGTGNPLLIAIGAFTVALAFWYLWFRAQGTEVA